MLTKTPAALTVIVRIDGKPAMVEGEKSCLFGGKYFVCELDPDGKERQAFLKYASGTAYGIGVSDDGRAIVLRRYNADGTSSLKMEYPVDGDIVVISHRPVIQP